MGRYGARNFESDASAEFFEDAYAARFLKVEDHDRAWGYFYREWSRLPAETQDEYGVEYLLGVLELWLWDDLRADQIQHELDFLADAISEAGPRINGKHPGFMASRSLFALSRFEERGPNPETRAQALELIAWSRAAIPRLGHYGGPGSRDAGRAQRSLKKLERSLG